MSHMDIEQDKEDTPFVKPNKEDEEELANKQLLDQTTRIIFLKQLLLSLIIAMIVVLVFIIIAANTSIGKIIHKHILYVGIAGGSLCLIFLLLLIAKPCVKIMPINWFLYILFIASMAIIAAFVNHLIGTSEIGHILFTVEWMTTVTIAALFGFTAFTDSEVGIKLGVIFAIVYGAAVFIVTWYLNSKSYIHCGLCAAIMAAFIYFVIWNLNSITHEKKYSLGPNDSLIGAIHVYMDFFIFPYLIMLVFEKFQKD